MISALSESGLYRGMVRLLNSGKKAQQSSSAVCHKVYRWIEQTYPKSCFDQNKVKLNYLTYRHYVGENGEKLTLQKSCSQ